MSICKKCQKKIQDAGLLPSAGRVVLDESENAIIEDTCQKVLFLVPPKYYPQSAFSLDFFHIKTAVLTQWPVLKRVNGLLPNSRRNNLRIVPGISRIPGARRPMRDMEYCSDYDIFDSVWGSKFHRAPTAHWSDNMYQFFLSLTPDDFINILTYSYHGDKMVNDYYVHHNKDSTDNHGVVNKRDSYIESKKFISMGENAFEYCLFEPQARQALHMPDETVNELDEKLKTLDDASWNDILRLYARDMQVLFSSCPKLDEPMTVFRGEDTHQDRKDNISLRGGDVFADTKMISMKSFSIDPCVACQFSRQRLPSGKINNDGDAGRIWMVTFDKGSSLLFVGGFNIVTDTCEAECRVAPPFMVQNGRDITHIVRPKEGWKDESLQSLQIVSADAVTMEDTSAFYNNVAQMSWNIVRAVRNAR